MTRWAPALALACAAACTGDADPPPLPTLELRPRTAELEALAAHAPPALDVRRHAEVVDLLELAFVPGRASARIAATSKRALLDAEDAMLALEVGLESEHLAVRTNAAFELGRLGRQPAVVPLLKALKYERDPGGRLWLAAALTTLGIHSGLPDITAAMQRADTAEPAGQQAITICKAAGIPLSERPTWTELRDALESLHTQWREEGITPEPADPATTGRLARLLLDLQGFQLRPVDEARYIVANAGTLGLPLLRIALGAEERYLRQHALEIVRRLGHPARRLGPAVLALLGDPLSRADAARTLGAIGEPSAYPYLIALLDDPDPELRAAAAGALGPLGDPRAVPHLEALLTDPTQPMDVRVRAAFSLGLFELERPARRFLEDLRDQGGYHRPTLDELLDELDAAERRSR